MVPALLDNLAGPGKPLRAEPPDAAEFAGLLRSGRTRLKDASNKSLALESRFDLGYNAAHAMHHAALRRPPALAQRHPTAARPAAPPRAAPSRRSVT
jgi:hypothetical protein